MMIFRVIVLFAVLAIASAGLAGSPTVSATIRDTNVNGLEGLNLAVVAPFRIQDYVVGFKYGLKTLKTLPESIFAQKSFNLGDSSLDVDADFEVEKSVLNVGTRWTSEKYGVSVTANADTENRFKDVGVSAQQNFKGNTYSFTGVYDVIRKAVRGNAVVEASATRLALNFDSEDVDPELSVARKIDENNIVNPSIRLRSGKLTYGFLRKWEGGSVSGRLFPGEKVSVQWKDQGSAGSWVTTADVPLDKPNETKVSFSREWSY